MKLSRLHGTELEIAPLVMSHRHMVQKTKILADRLKLTREAGIGLSPTELCKRIGIKLNRYIQYESGERRITEAVAVLLCEEFRLTLDWIYRGDPSGLPHELRLKIRAKAA